MAQETAVDYIFKKLDVLCRLTPQTRVTGTSEEWQNLYEQAKAMEKEQIVIAHGTKSNGRLKNDGQFIIGEITGEQYYNETYNK